MSKLRISPELALPIEAVTQAIGIVAKRRVGKSYTARRFAEQLFLAKQQVVIVDPKGDWWGIRSSADGKAPGLSVVILGGEHKAVPLDVSDGELVAKLVVEERVSALLDLSEFRKREVARFMADFLETLYRLKAKEALRTPVMMFIDEADAIAPQKPQEGEERMLGAAEDIVRRGGQRGIGCTMITQRTAVLNKNVLTQCEMLVALRTISPHDLKAMQAWIDVHGSIEERDTLMASLPSLPQGDAWFWSPGWPTSDGIFKRVHVLPIETFDSGATPKPGEKRKEPKTIADVDLAALQRQMAATIEKAKADDPRELRKQIAQLEKDKRELSRSVGDLSSAKHIVGNLDQEYRRGLADGEQRGRAAAMRDLQRIVGKDLRAVGTAIERSIEMATNIGPLFSQLRGTLEPQQLETLAASAPPPPRTPPRAAALPRTPDPARRPLASVSSNENGRVTGVEQRILNTLRALEDLGVTPVDKPTAAALVGYHPNAKSYANALGALRSAGKIDYPNGGQVALTDDGRAIAESQLSIHSLDELHNIWFDRLGNIAKRILEPVIEAYPGSVEATAVAERAGYHPNAKSFANMRGRLRTLGLIEYPRPGELSATKTLFPEGLR